VEISARELSSQLGAAGWKSVLCFERLPPDPVRRFLELPNVSLETIADCWRLSARTSWALAGVLRQYRPRILHLYFTGFLSPYPWLARLLGVEKVFFTDQGSQPEGFVPVRAALWKRAAARCINAPLHGMVSVSNYGRRTFLARGLLPESRCHLIYNSVDMARALDGASCGPAFRLRHGIPSDRLVVTQVSWMIPEKGLDDLLAAARMVVEAEPRAHFVLAGEGDHRPRLEQLARDWGIAGHVTFTGVVQDPLLEGLYAASDVVCQMSRWEEVFGYVIAEAMANRRPVVGTRVGGIPEVIHDGISGLLVERGDTTAMAEKILTLLRNPEQRQSMGEAGYRIVAEKFNNQTNVGGLIKLYGI